MSRVTIGSIGNVLQGDDAVGPYTIALLRSRCEFGPEIEIKEFGTPGLGFLADLREQDLLILVDAVESGGEPGSLVRYDRDALVRSAGGGVRLEPHSPALGEALRSAEMLGCAPRRVLLIGVAVAATRTGTAMSPEAREGARRACDCIVAELRRIGYAPQLRREPLSLAPWWTEQSITSR